VNAPNKVKAATVEDALNELDASQTLHGAMALAFAEIEAATKGAPNPAFKQDGKVSKYADLGSVIGAVKPALIAHGLFFTQHCQPSPDGVIVETFLHHRGGNSLSLGSLYVPANKRDPQGFGSALTYARRYALQTAFGVPTEDDDGNAAVAAMREPERSARIAPAQISEIEKLAPKADKTISDICNGYGISELAELDAERAGKCIARLNELAKEPANA
jgi:hypothetical protein